MAKEYFPRVKEAREALKEKALDLLNEYMLIIGEARLAGDFEVAAKHVQWLMAHTGAEDGVRIIDEDAGKPKEIAAKNSGPSINIGFQIGGIPNSKTQKKLTSTVIDVTPEPVDE